MNDERLLPPSAPPAGATPEGPPVAPVDAPPWVTAEAPPRKRRVRKRHVLLASVAAIAGLLVLVAATGRMDTLARGLRSLFAPSPPPPPPTVAVLPTAAAPASRAYSFTQLDIHPDRLYGAYFTDPILSSDSAQGPNLIAQFRNFLDTYTTRQKDDDNFTIRVVDDRSGETLEVYELERERAAYEAGGRVSWHEIDQLRRAATNRLVAQHAAQGVPREAIVVKWGRANQVQEARERDLPYIEYEIRLARYLGLSLLATEIGTVETFNSDQLVSSVGARSRYQMMPYILRQGDIHTYQLPTAGGPSVSVYEEWHPLLAMEPAFVLLRGYANAVGHEIPGISAYHTGPGNIFQVYQLFLTNPAGRFVPQSTVMDAYMWAVTEGYPVVSSRSSFKTYSRGYVATAYGSLRATERSLIDPELTVRLERVQLAPGQTILLADLLTALAPAEDDLTWMPGTEGAPLYERFRAMNPHFSLPEGLEAVPTSGNVRLSATVGEIPVRFFLPLGATEALRRAGVQVLDEAATFRYDPNTYGMPPPSEVTEADRRYAALVQDVAGFGFTEQNRRELARLADEFEALARQNPSHYRLTQLQIIRTHLGMWKTSAWEKLAAAADAVRGSIRAPVQPPHPLDPLTPRLLNGGLRESR